MPNLTPLLNYIIDQTNQQGGAIGRTALTKLVYLIDLEHYKRHGKQATGLQWRFHHYGPYAPELQSQIQSIGLHADEAQFTTKSANRQISGYRYQKPADWRETQRAFNTAYDASVKRCVDQVVEQWALEPLPTILDYVYFETAPMQDVKRGQLLDFSKIQPEPIPPPNTAKLEFSDAFVKDMRQRLKERREKRESDSKKPRKATEPRYDDVYYEACKIMQADEPRLYLRPGTKVIEPTEE